MNRSDVLTASFARNAMRVAAEIPGASQETRRLFVRKKVIFLDNTQGPRRKGKTIPVDFVWVFGGCSGVGFGDFYNSSKAMVGIWTSLGNKVVGNFGTGGHCNIHSYESIVQCLDGGSNRLIHR
jgi:hypothetical protein